MTSVERSALLLMLLLAGQAGYCGLGEADSGLESERAHMHASHSVRAHSGFRVHILETADHSRTLQYADSAGRIFAVSWIALFKPDLNTLLGSSFGDYATAATQAAQNGGAQHHFHQTGSDLVVQSSAHLNVFRGFAYRPSLLPPGFSLDGLGQE